MPLESETLVRFRASKGGISRRTDRSETWIPSASTIMSVVRASAGKDAAKPMRLAARQTTVHRPLRDTSTVRQRYGAITVCHTLRYLISGSWTPRRVPTCQKTPYIAPLVDSLKRNSRKLA